MHESYMWLVNHLGGVFKLGTFHRKFKQLENTWDDAVSVKRLSASHWCAWAIGHDHRVYIYVRSSDVPIRVPETTFENQRWSPIHGFSKSSLIKTDRPAWSNEVGTIYRPKESVRLQSAHWEWEGDWLIDDNLRGEVVGIEGWQYAFDFPAVYTPEKHWNSFVRKRKWIRFRRFSSTDVWARISDMEVVERSECFIDISVGGFLMPSQPAGFLSVWAVTNSGHVYVRTNVNHDNPEGSTWQEVDISDQIGIINISVGASNLVWAVTWDGNTLVRTQVSRSKIYGSSWVVVEHPNNSTRFMQVSVGRNSVWAISREGKVWFRKGTSGDDMFWNHAAALGTIWVEMVGEMSQVAVSSNDQVFAIDVTGKNVCFRTGVTTADPTGKTWQPVSLHEDMTRLQKEGLLSEGEVCSCGDPDVSCALHIEARPRLSSTTTSSSSTSAATNVDESPDGFSSTLQQYQPFPIHISEPFAGLDTAVSSWNPSQMIRSDIVDALHNQEQSSNTSSPEVVSCFPSQFQPPDLCSSTVHKEEATPLIVTAGFEKSCSFDTITSSTISEVSGCSFDTITPPTTSEVSSCSFDTITPSTISEVSMSEEVTFYQHRTETVALSPVLSVSYKVTKSVHNAVTPLGDTSIALKQQKEHSAVTPLGGTSIASKQQKEHSVVTPLGDTSIALKQQKEHSAVTPLGDTSIALKQQKEPNAVTPLGGTSIASKQQKEPSADLNILDYTTSKNEPSSDKNICLQNSQRVTQTNPEICYRESVDKTNSQSYVTSSFGNQSNIEETIVKQASLIPRSEQPIDNILMLRSGDNKVITEVTMFDNLPENITIPINVDHPCKPHSLNTDSTLISHKSVSDNDLISTHPDKRLHIPVTSASAFVTDSTPQSLRKSVTDVAEILSESKTKNKLNNESNRLSFEENNYSPAVCNIYTRDVGPSMRRHTIDQTYNKEHMILKKKSKERRPKIVDLSYNDPNDDSIVFKTFKTRRKRRVKYSTNDEMDKIDTLSVSSDTSHYLISETDLQMMNDGISMSAESLEKETDIDYVEGSVFDSPYDQYSPDSSYQTSFQSTFPNLASFSGDYLAAVGFSTDSALSMLSDLGTFQTQIIFSKNLKRNTPKESLIENNRGNWLTPTASGNNSKMPLVRNDSGFSKPVLTTVDIDSAKSASTTSDSQISHISSDSGFLKPVLATVHTDGLKSASTTSGNDSQIPHLKRNSEKPVLVVETDSSKTASIASGKVSPIPLVKSDSEKPVLAKVYTDGLKSASAASSNDIQIPLIKSDVKKAVLAVVGTDSSKNADSTSDIDSLICSVSTCDRNCSETSCDINSSKAISEVCDTKFSAMKETTSNNNNKSCDQNLEDSSQPRTVSNYLTDVDNSCDITIHIQREHDIDDKIIPEDNSVVGLSHTNSMLENIPLRDGEHNIKLMGSTAGTNARDEIENDTNKNNALETAIVNSDSMGGLVEEQTKINSLGSQQLLRIDEFVDNRFSSVDSEEILDFVTDLLVSDDEKLQKKSDEDEEISQSQTDESLSSMKFKCQSQISMTSIKSTGSSLSNMTRSSVDDGEQNESDNTGPAGDSRNRSSSQTSSTTNHPQTLPFSSMMSAKKVSMYTKSPSPSYVPTGDIIPLMTLTVAQPRLYWKWLDATSCVIDDPSTVEWLSNTFKESETKKKVLKIAKQLREDVMKKLQDRNKREVLKFKDIEQAVKRTTWVKKAGMQIYFYGRKCRWIPCHVELEQGITNLSEGSLTVHYLHKAKQKNLQISLSEMSCVKTCSDPDTPSGFVVYTPETIIIHQPLVLKASSENEAAEWIGCLGTANAVLWNMNCTITPGAIWSCTFIGDVFISSITSTLKHLSDLCWSQHGGHMQLVETGPSGVTWALGFDKMPYVYNGGYGGAVNTGASEMSDNIHQIMDQHKVFVYENQTWFPVVGWCCKGVFHNNFHWLTESGRSVETKEEVNLPSSKCQWISEWTVDFSTPGGVDTNGWQYSSHLYGPFYPRQHLRSSYRRRRWFRQYRITVFGPWHAAGSLGLVDLSVQVDPVTSTSDPVVLWAVGANGDVLCRNGVTASNPKGDGWVHVATYLDKPFKSISVGGSYRVWGIAGDGSAWFRPGVSPYNQAGTCWLQVVPPPPCSFLLRQVSAGATSVWAVDTGDNLWRRENITPTFPEGTGWEAVANRVKRVTVGPRDQVWIVADASFSRMKHGAGVIYNRVGITSAKPAGTDWEVVIGSGWAHVSVRGVSEFKRKYSLSSVSVESSK